MNLATCLVLDAADGCYDVALVVSNDTDLVLPIRATRERFAVAIGVSAPCYIRGRRPMRELEGAADFSCHITRKNKSCLKASQLPPVVSLPGGKTVFCPDRWLPVNTSRRKDI